MNFSTVADIKEKAKLKISAATQPPTWNPSNKLSAKTTMAALITKENKPNVRQVIGKEKKLKMGFKKVFKIDNTKATFTASKGVFTIGLLKPFQMVGKMYDSAITVATFIRKRMIIFIVDSFVT